MKEAGSSGQLHGIKCDVSKEDEILSMFGEIKEKFGGLDICVNNAGVIRCGGLIDGNTEDWKAMTDVWLYSTKRPIP